MFDALIVGGGPAGSRVAFRLARAGCKVAILEQKATLGEPVCCTGIISRECANTYQINGEIILRRANSARFFAPSGDQLRLQSPDVQACIVGRPTLDSAMADQAIRAGAQYLLDCPVSEVQIDKDNAKVRIEPGHGETSFEAKVVVIASGFGSKLAQRAGIGTSGDFVMGAQMEVESNLDEIEVYLGKNIAPGFFAWLVPTVPGMALLGLMARRNCGHHLKDLVSSLKDQAKISEESGEITYRPIPLKPPARTFGQRLVVVGSEAGQVKPTTGGGIYFGLLCADIAADTLEAAFGNGDFSAKNLAGYERSWKQKLGRELRLGCWTRRIFEQLHDKQVEKLFKIARSANLDVMLNRMDGLSFDWHGNVVKRLLREKALAGTIGLLKAPFN